MSWWKPWTWRLKMPRKAGTERPDRVDNLEKLCEALQKELRQSREKLEKSCGSLQEKTDRLQEQVDRLGKLPFVPALPEGPAPELPEFYEVQLDEKGRVKTLKSEEDLRKKPWKPADLEHPHRVKKRMLTRTQAEALRKG